MWSGTQMPTRLFSLVVLWNAVVFAGSGCIACGASSEGDDRLADSTREQPSGEDDAHPAAHLDCAIPLDARLAVTDSQELAGLQATLHWDPDRGDCSLDAGREMPRGDAAILRFSIRDGEYDVRSVSPWRLSVPEGREIPDRLADGTEYVVVANYEMSSALIAFQFSDEHVRVSQVEVQ